eukprot:SAG31_NODE_730_length_12505_cov_3.807109_11_plen_370_part_00
MLNRSSCFIAGTRDEDDYVRTVRQLQQLGFGPSERRAINAAVAAVLFAGNLQFTADSISGGTTCGAPGTRSLQALNSLGAALGVRADELEVVLTTREISTRHHARGEPAVSCRVTLPPETAQLYRDTLVQLLFTALVQWLTTRVNTALFTPRSREMASRATLAVVDGYGFDRAERSSGFSNLLSNYAFERMASLYYEVNVWSPLRGQASDGLAEVSPADLTAIAGGMADKDVRGGGSMLPNPADIVQLVDGRPEGILALVDKVGSSTDHLVPASCYYVSRLWNSTENTMTLQFMHRVGWCDAQGFGSCSSRKAPCSTRDCCIRGITARRSWRIWSQRCSLSASRTVSGIFHDCSWMWSCGLLCDWCLVK